MHSPLSLTLDPRLDAAIAEGYDAWERVLREVGLAKATAWCAQRAAGEIPRDDLRDHLEALIEAADEDEATFARIELAELVEEVDDELADRIWERVLLRGMEVGDGDLVFESSSRLAAIAEDLGDPLAAAEYFIDFLNWRRLDGSVSDPEAVNTAFDEVIRLAEIDNDPKAVSLFAFRQANFTKMAESEAEQASSGDWERDRAPYASWS